METNTNTLLTWEAKAKVDHKRGGVWFIASGIFCGIMVMYGVLSGSYTAAVIFVLLPVAFHFVRNQGHRTHSANIQEQGFEFDGVLTPWDELQEFWILQGKDYYELHVAYKKNRQAEIVVQTGALDPYEIRDALARFIPQTNGKREKILDAIIRFCKL